MIRYVQNKKVVYSKIDDEIVMMDVESGFYFGLNTVGSMIWDVLKEEKTISEVVAFLLSEYDVGYDQCLQETELLIKKMLEYKVITVAGG